MRSQEVSLHHEIRKTVHMAIAPDKTDATTTAELSRLEDPQRGGLSSHLKASVVFWEDVCFWHKRVFLLTEVIAVDL